MNYSVLVGRTLRNGGTNGWKNIGDYIQSLAGAQYLPRIDEYYDRDDPEIEGEITKMIMNAWYMWNPEKFPVFERIIPLPISMHISPMISDILFKNEKVINWFKKYEPIGCRDIGTTELLKSNGIRSYFSGCLTLTLGRKYKFEGERKKLIFVDPYLSSIRKELNVFDFIKSLLFGICHLKTLLLVNFSHFENFQMLHL